MDSMSPIVENLVSKFGYERPQYAVIIDAGSTGSRVLAYKFHKSYIGILLNLFQYTYIIILIWFFRQ